MKVFLNHTEFPVVIPYNTLEGMGEPRFLQILPRLDEKRIVIRSARRFEAEVVTVPLSVYSTKAYLCIPANELLAPLRTTMGWEDVVFETDPYAVAEGGVISAIAIDLTECKVTKDTVAGPFVRAASE